MIVYLFLNKNGRIIITVPSPQVDSILSVLQRFKIVDGMSVDEHYGFDPSQTETLFMEPKFKLIHKESFQLGLNNLFVFEKV